MRLPHLRVASSRLQGLCLCCTCEAVRLGLPTVLCSLCVGGVGGEAGRLLKRAKGTQGRQGAWEVAQ